MSWSHFWKSMLTCASVCSTYTAVLLCMKPWTRRLGMHTHYISLLWFQASAWNICSSSCPTHPECVCVRHREQILLVLLRVTECVMKRPPSIMPHGKKSNTLSGRLAGAIFQVPPTNILWQSAFSISLSVGQKNYLLLETCSLLVRVKAHSHQELYW